MQPTFPLWVKLLVISASLVVPVLALLVFQRFARKHARNLVVPSAVFIGVWLALAFALAIRGFFARGGADLVPPIAYAILPLIIGYLAFLTIPSLRAVVDEIPPHWMIGLQLYRAAGVVFLAEWMLGALPGSFALPAGIGDVSIGLAAPMVASLVKRGSPHARGAAILWNVLGLADLVVAVTMGVLTSPGPLHRLALDAPNVAITMLPLVLVPIIAVPFSILLHLISLHRLIGRVQAPLAVRGMA
ncbi:MAG TPA: hypothetical protein VGJ12_05365 [Gemmatimonadaceae bacterium]